MKATLMYKAGDVRVEQVSDPVIEEPTDAVIRVTYALKNESRTMPYRGWGQNWRRQRSQTT